ncbi:MAG TPA: hypothetical protein VMF61_03550 [Candidatus Acidoferrales bacterium]|nr:hypothetical protein [Candidatus Acidoferrales bacterium]
MRPIYIGFGILLLAIVAVFAIMNWQHGRVVAEAWASPTPQPGPTTKPIALVDGEKLGTPYFKAKVPDLPRGGLGQPVDGITCMGMEGENIHIHTHLALFDNGKQIMVPALIGIAPNPSMPLGGCYYWIHTHSGDGIIHLESPQVTPPTGGVHYTLGMFFDIWGQPLARDDVAGFKGPVTAYVNGTKYDGELRDIPLMSHQQVVLEVGSPVPPPNYTFPPND